MYDNLIQQIVSLAEEVLNINTDIEYVSVGITCVTLSPGYFIQVWLEKGSVSNNIAALVRLNNKPTLIEDKSLYQSLNTLYNNLLHFKNTGKWYIFPIDEYDL